MFAAVEFRELAVFAGGIFFFGFGVLLLRAYLHKRDGDRKFAKAAVRVSGVVVEILQEESNHSDGNGFWYRPLVRFTDVEGREQAAKTTTGRGGPLWKVGEELSIWYSPEAPEEVRLDDKWSLGGSTSGIGFGSVAFLAIGAYLMIWMGRVIFVR